MPSFSKRECPRCLNLKEMHHRSLICAPCRMEESKNVSNTLRGKAQSETAKAIRRGELIRRPCEVCNMKRTDAHHDDYAKPLDVRWLCRSCHKLYHSKFGAGKNAYAAA